LLTETIQASRYPLPPRIKALKAIPAKLELPARHAEPIPSPKPSERR
jgi:hypothetical protein